MSFKRKKAALVTLLTHLEDPCHSPVAPEIRCARFSFLRVCYECPVQREAINPPVPMRSWLRMNLATDRNFLRFTLGIKRKGERCWLSHLVCLSQQGAQLVKCFVKYSNGQILLSRKLFSIVFEVLGIFKTKYVFWRLGKIIKFLKSTLAKTDITV